MVKTARILIGLGLLSGLISGACAASPDSTAPARQDIVLPMDGQSIDGTVPPNATLEVLLRGHELPSETVGSLLTAIRSVFDPRDLRARQNYRITRTIDGLFREFRYEIDGDRLLSVTMRRGETQPKAEVITLPKEFVTEALTVEIGKGQSLVGVLESRDENIQLALELANIFGGDVDFNADLQPGDRVDVLFERAMRNGEFVGYGRVRAAILRTDGRQLHAILFPDSDDRPAYFDEEGRSLKRQFLKSPLPFDPRVTSRFSYSRLHPVHGTKRPHLGVDYHAAYGTAVKTVAAGTVDFVGTNGEAGRMVRVRHAGGYQTAYLHLSAFAPGLRVGSRVAQGDLIGRVGSSGTVTGPHLDYRIIKNGTYVDPLNELKRMPKGEPITPARLPAFTQVKDDELNQMTTLLSSLAGAAARPTSPAAHVK